MRAIGSKNLRCGKMLILVAGLLVLIQGPSHAGPANKKEAPVRVRGDDFQRVIAERAGEVVIVCFEASWAKRSRRTSEVVFSLAEDLKNTSMVTVDVDESRALLRKYKVKALPHILVLDDGKEVGKIVGDLAKEELAKKFAALFQK